MSENTSEDGTFDSLVPFIRRVRIKNYKSIAECDVVLGPLTVLVGPNGAGKSNFLDALAFTARALETTPAEALDERGGLREVLRRVPERVDSFSISIDVAIPWWPSTPVASAHYQFEIGPAAEDRLAFEIISEECIIEGHGAEVAHFSAGRGYSNFAPPGRSFDAAVFDSDRLLLPTVGTQGDFARLYTGLTRLRFYNFQTEVLRKPQRPSARAVLRSDGEGFGDVLSKLADANDPWVKNVLTRTSVQSFKMNAPSNQSRSENSLPSPSKLKSMAALTEAAEHVQIIAASQSADLLDREDFDVSAIRPVAIQEGLTIIGEVDSASREIAKEKLMTLGELMRGNQLVPSPPEGTDSEP